MWGWVSISNRNFGQPYVAIFAQNGGLKEHLTSTLKNDSLELIKKKKFSEKKEKKFKLVLMAIVLNPSLEV